MNWHDLHRKVAIKLGGNPALADERPFILVDSQRQLLTQIDIEEGVIAEFPVSTAANGLGTVEGSFKTPTGIHRIRQKIGGGESIGSIFEGREPIGKIARNFNNTNGDEISSRIMWLDGLEEGLNKGGMQDSYSRYIYIHGTTDEGRIGQPVSHGCVRMKNSDIIELFDDVLVNDLVIIH